LEQPIDIDLAIGTACRVNLLGERVIHALGRFTRKELMRQEIEHRVGRKRLN